MLARAWSDGLDSKASSDTTKARKAFKCSLLVAGVEHLAPVSALINPKKNHKVVSQQNHQTLIRSHSVFM